MTDKEYNTLKRKATRNGMSVSKYIREFAIHSDEKAAPTIDIAPLKSIDHELKKQGANLNQLMRFLNTYGIEGYNAEEVRRVLGLKGELYIMLSNTFGDLREEAARHHVRILDSSESEIEEDNAEPSENPALKEPQERKTCDDAIRDGGGSDARCKGAEASCDAESRADGGYEVPRYAKHARW